MLAVSLFILIYVISDIFFDVYPKSNKKWIDYILRTIYFIFLVSAIVAFNSSFREIITMVIFLEIYKEGKEKIFGEKIITTYNHCIEKLNNYIVKKNQAYSVVIVYLVSANSLSTKRFFNFFAKNQKQAEKIARKIFEKENRVYIIMEIKTNRLFDELS